ncbi:MAG: hypothetical protein JJE30_11000 [Desulfuromonadales bacterium]|nr:hypothetical protein [Desulfuromonadales bacterium]
MTIETKKTDLGLCKSFGDQDYSRYVRHQMSEQDVCNFEIHAQNCSCCLHGIRQATVAYNHQKVQAENELLHSNALSIMDRLDRSVFSIVIRAVQGMVELIKSTGEQLAMTPALTGVRSSSDNSVSDTVQPLRLVKEFEESRLSVEVTISPIEPEMLDVVVSLLDRLHEEFIPGVSVTCCGKSEMFDKLTDVNGQVIFRVPTAGFYELVMKKNDHLLGTMTLTGL